MSRAVSASAKFVLKYGDNTKVIRQFLDQDLTSVLIELARENKV